MSDLRDDLLASMAENAPAEEPVAAVETPSDDRPRDSSGKFLAKDTAAVVSEEVRAADKLVDAPKEETPTDAPKEEEEGTWKEDRAPSSWKPAIREKWNDLPPEVRAEIVRREEAAVVGARKLTEQLAPAQEFLSGLDPFIQEARQFGVNPTQHIANTLHTERALRTGDMPTKFQTLMGIADQYGIPLRDIINQSVGQEVLKSPKTQQAAVPPELQRELSEIRQWRESQERQSVRSEIEQFGGAHEFFNDVKPLMATLIQNGTAQGLADAYEKAVWMQPEVREVLLARQAGGKQQSTVATRQTAANRVGSVTPNSGVSVTLEDNESDDIHSIVRNAMIKQTSGRV